MPFAFLWNTFLNKLIVCFVLLLYCIVTYLNNSLSRPHECESPLTILAVVSIKSQTEDTCSVTVAIVLKVISVVVQWLQIKSKWLPIAVNAVMRNSSIVIVSWRKVEGQIQTRQRFSWWQYHSSYVAFFFIIGAGLIKKRCGTFAGMEIVWLEGKKILIRIHRRTTKEWSISIQWRIWRLAAGQRHCQARWCYVELSMKSRLVEIDSNIRSMTCVLMFDALREGVQQSWL